MRGNTNEVGYTNADVTHNSPDFHSFSSLFLSLSFSHLIPNFYLQYGCFLLFDLLTRYKLITLLIFFLFRFYLQERKSKKKSFHTFFPLLNLKGKIAGYLKFKRTEKREKKRRNPPPKKSETIYHFVRISVERYLIDPFYVFTNFPEGKPIWF